MTLIALVIVIIILLILAGITIVKLTDSRLVEKEKFATTDNIKFDYDINRLYENKIQILIIINGEMGLNKIEFPDGDILNCNGKNNIGIDYIIEIDIEYIFKIISSNGEEKVERIQIKNSDISYVNFYKEKTGAGIYDTDIVSYNGGNIMVENNELIIENDGVVLGQLQQLHGGINPRAHIVYLYKNDQLMYQANPGKNIVDINFPVSKGDKIYIKQYTDRSDYPVTGKAEIVYIKKY